MKIEAQEVCGLCFKTSNLKCIQINQTLMDMVKVLHKQTNLRFVDDLTICSICVEKIKAAFEFRMACLERESSEMFGNSTQMVHKADTENQKICGLCKNLKNVDSTIFLWKTLEENNIMEPFRRYLPQIDQEPTKYPLICEICQTSLTNYSDVIFLLTGVDAQHEEDHQVDLQGYSQPENGNLFENFKTEIDVGYIHSENKITETKIKEEVINEDDHFTDKNKTVSDTLFSFEARDIKINKGTKGEDEMNYVKKEAERCDDVIDADMKEMTNVHNIQGTNYAEFQFKNEEINVKSEPELFVSERSGAEETDEETLEQNNEEQVTKNITLVHQDSNIVDNLKNSDKVEMHKCQQCNYHSIYKNRIKIHMITHKNSDELEMYNCQQCIFQTKYKGSLKSHISLKHKTAEDIVMNKCQHCNFQSKYRSVLQYHMLCHKEFDEIVMYKCHQCTYQTKYKQHLKQHMVTHRNSDEVKIFNCRECSYQAKFKYNLKIHMLSHHSSDEVKIFKCQECTYQTKVIAYFKRHMLQHKNPEEKEIYKCLQCTYQSKFKYYFTRHVLVHKSTNEVEMHKCQQCTYQTKCRFRLKTHMITHKNSNEVEKHKCKLCTYQTKLKAYLTKHMLTHKSSDEIKMYKCFQCKYQSKFKMSLKRHMIVHKKYEPKGMLKS